MWICLWGYLIVCIFINTLKHCSGTQLSDRDTCLLSLACKLCYTRTKQHSVWGQSPASDPRPFWIFQPPPMPDLASVLVGVPLSGFRVVPSLLLAVFPRPRAASSYPSLQQALCKSAMSLRALISSPNSLISATLPVTPTAPFPPHSTSGSSDNPVWLDLWPLISLQAVNRGNNRNTSLSLRTPSPLSFCG